MGGDGLKKGWDERPSPGHYLRNGRRGRGRIHTLEFIELEMKK